MKTRIKIDVNPYSVKTYTIESRDNVDTDDIFKYFVPVFGWIHYIYDKYVWSTIYYSRATNKFNTLETAKETIDKYLVSYNQDKEEEARKKISETYYINHP
jgi:hypothetical protein